MSERPRIDRLIEAAELALEKELKKPEPDAKNIRYLTTSLQRLESVRQDRNNARQV